MPIHPTHLTMTTSLVLFSILFLTTTSAFLSKGEHLRDVNGHAVVSGSSYYIVSAIRGAGGGGVKPTTLKSSSSCPSYVGQARHDLDHGTPVKLFSVNREDATSIDVNEKVIIQFTAADNCVNSPVWTVKNHNGEGLLSMGGKPPVYPPPIGIAENMFQFRKSEREHVYTLDYCRCNLCLLPCDSVSKTSVDGRIVLNITSSVDHSASKFPVVLIKTGDKREQFPSVIRTSVDVN